MKVANKSALITAIDKSAEELHQRIDIHRCLMTTILEQRISDEGIKQLSLQPYSPDETRLKEAIRETIDVLEVSRRAFKSKRLEALRKKLTRILIEAR